MDRYTIKVDDDNINVLYTIQEVAKGIIVKVEDENGVTTNLGVSSNEWFDSDSQSESDFDNDIGGNEDKNDENIQFPYSALIQLYVYCPNRPRIHFYAIILVL